MSFFALTGFTIFFLILFAGIFLNLLELPGTVVIFFDVFIYSILTGFEQIGWKIIILLLASSVLAEAIEFFWSISEPPQQSVSSQKSIKAAVLGSITGIFLLTPFWGGPGIWIGFFLGGLTGIIIMEIIRQSKLKAPFRTLNSFIFNTIGKNAVKGFISLCMIAFSLSNIYS